MESNIESNSPDNVDKGVAFRKPSSDRGNRKYRRHSSGSGSDSPSLDDRAQVLEGKRKNNERELGMESGRDRYEKGGDIHRHSDRRSYRSSHDHRRHDDYDKYHKRADGDRSSNRSSGYGRESSSGTRSDRNRQGSDYDRSGDHRRSRDKYSREGSDGDGEGKDKGREEKRRHKDKDYDTERVTSERRRKSSFADDSNSSRDDKRNYGKSLEDRKSEKTHASEEGTNHGRHSSSSASAEKESGGSRLGDTHKGSIKDIGREKGDIMDKRKHDNRESEGHIERFARDTDSKDYSTSTTRKSYGRSDDNSTRSHHDKESSPKKCKLLTGYKGKDNGKEGDDMDDSDSSTSSQSTTLDVENLSPNITDDELKKSFSVHGEIVSATVKQSLFKGQSSTGCVQFKNRVDAEKAFVSMDGEVEIDGKVPRLKFAPPPATTPSSLSRKRSREGKRVVHSDLTAKKLAEVQKALGNNSSEMEIEEPQNRPSGLDHLKEGSNGRDTSTCGGLHSIGSDLTRTQGRSRIQQNDSLRNEQTTGIKQEQGNTPNSKREPVPTRESILRGIERTYSGDGGNSRCSTQDKQQARKASTVKEPILQNLKRRKS